MERMSFLMLERCAWRVAASGKKPVSDINVFPLLRYATVRKCDGPGRTPSSWTESRSTTRALATRVSIFVRSTALKTLLARVFSRAPWGVNTGGSLTPSTRSALSSRKTPLVSSPSCFGVIRSALACSSVKKTISGEFGGNSRYSPRLHAAGYRKQKWSSGCEYTLHAVVDGGNPTSVKLLTTRRAPPKMSVMIKTAWTLTTNHRIIDCCGV